MVHDFNRNIVVIEGETIELSKMENIILEELLKNKNGVVKYEKLRELIYKDTEMDKCLLQNISSRICRLKKKLKGKLKTRTIIGLGYRIG